MDSLTTVIGPQLEPLGPVFGPLAMIAGGLIVLVFSGDFLVSGSVHLARRHNIPTALLGLTVVAFGTSAPELVIGISAALKGQTDIAIGNVVGSNICNVLLVLGLPALLFTIRIVEAEVIRVNGVFMMLVTVVFVAFSIMGGGLDLIDGVILLCLLGGFLWICAFQAREAGRVAFDEELEEIETAPLPFGMPPIPSLIWLTIIASLAGLWFGAELTVTYSMELASRYEGVTAGIVGLSIIAFGTSLPELATTVAAAAKREHAMAFGNIVGSNIFNILSIAGVTTVLANINEPGTVISLEAIKPFADMKNNVWVDIGVMVASTVLLFTLILMHWKRITRISGAALFLAYAAYVFYLMTPALHSV